MCGAFQLKRTTLSDIMMFLLSLEEVSMSDYASYEWFSRTNQRQHLMEFGKTLSTFSFLFSSLLNTNFLAVLIGNDKFKYF